MDQFIIIPVSRDEFEEIIRTILRDHLNTPTDNHLDPVSNDFYMNPSEAAKYLNISKVTLWKWKKANKIPYTKIGRSIRYRKSEIDKALKDDRTRRISK